MYNWIWNYIKFNLKKHKGLQLTTSMPMKDWVYFHESLRNGKDDDVLIVNLYVNDEFKESIFTEIKGYRTDKPFSMNNKIINADEAIL